MQPAESIGKGRDPGPLTFLSRSLWRSNRLFCAGYGAYWPPEHHLDREVVARINDEDWLFSNDAFLQVIDELEKESRWKYSGETELLLIPTVLAKEGGSILQYESALVCNLEAMARDKAFSSVRAFLDSIFRYAKSQSASDSAWKFSDMKGIEVAGGVLKNFVLSLLPSQLRSVYKQASHYAIKSIAADF